MPQYSTLENWMAKNELSAHSLARQFGFYKAEDFENYFGNLVNKEEYTNEDGELDSNAIEDAWLSEFEDYLLRKFDEWHHKYTKLPANLILYRAVRLRDISKLDQNNLGVYWTDDSGSAYSYGSDNREGDLYVLKAKVGKDEIDWDFTIWNNINPFTGEVESEINIKENSPVEVLDIEGPQGWIGKSFKGNVGKIGGKSLATASILDFPRKKLSEDLWQYDPSGDDGDLPVLKSSLRYMILNSAEKYLRMLNLSLKACNIYGGAASYQWSPGCDIDVSVYAERWPSNAEDIVGKYQSFFKKIEIPFQGFSIHFFLKPPMTPNIEVSEASYDVVEDEWTLPPLILPENFDPDEYFKPFIKIAEAKTRKFDALIGKLLRSRKTLEKASQALKDARDPDVVLERIEKEKQIIKRLVSLLVEKYLRVRKQRYALHDKLREKLLKDGSLTQYERFQEPEIVWKYLDRSGYAPFLQKLHALEKDNKIDKVLSRY